MFPQRVFLLASYSKRSKLSWKRQRREKRRQQPTTDTWPRPQVKHQLPSLLSYVSQNKLNMWHTHTLNYWKCSGGEGGVALTQKPEHERKIHIGRVTPPEVRHMRGTSRQMFKWQVDEMQSPNLVSGDKTVSLQLVSVNDCDWLAERSMVVMVTADDALACECWGGGRPGAGFCVII